MQKLICSLGFNLKKNWHCSEVNSKSPTSSCDRTNRIKKESLKIELSIKNDQSHCMTFFSDKAFFCTTFNIQSNQSISFVTYHS